ncbi:MAG TPA: cryptochrome/photolyase family protein, partial [Chitinophagaceae bacterium]|nr:cryptochrome/photolyase family protein [Chitinophagaceae bacterium]
MKAISLVFPHQLFQVHPALDISRPVVLLEEWLYFKQYPFHQQKLILHRASMRWYAQDLQKKGYKVQYINATDSLSDIRHTIAHLAREGYTKIHVVNPSDDWLLRRMEHACRKHSIELMVYANPNFLNEPNDTSIPKNGKQLFYQTGFYIQQRKQRKLLLDAQGGPLGGQWTFDADNRQKFPAKGVLPNYQMPQLDAFREEAVAYVQKNFAQHYGSSKQPFA